MPRGIRRWNSDTSGCSSPATTAAVRIQPSTRCDATTRRSEREGPAEHGDDEHGGRGSTGGAARSAEAGASVGTVPACRTRQARPGRAECGKSTSTGGRWSWCSRRSSSSSSCGASSTRSRGRSPRSPSPASSPWPSTRSCRRPSELLRCNRGARGVGGRRRVRRDRHRLLALLLVPPAVREGARTRRRSSRGGQRSRRPAGHRRRPGPQRRAREGAGAGSRSCPHRLAGNTAPIERAGRSLADGLLAGDGHDPAGHHAAARRRSAWCRRSRRLVPSRHRRTSRPGRRARLRGRRPLRRRIAAGRRGRRASSC